MPNLLEIKSVLKLLLSNIFFSFDLNLNGLKIIVRKTPNKTNEMDIKYILLKSKRISSLENNDKILLYFFQDYQQKSYEEKAKN